jgi:hypothetical protein
MDRRNTVFPLQRLARVGYQFPGHKRPGSTEPAGDCAQCLPSNSVPGYPFALREAQYARWTAPLSRRDTARGFKDPVYVAGRSHGLVSRC